MSIWLQSSRSFAKTYTFAQADKDFKPFKVTVTHLFSDGHKYERDYVVTDLFHSSHFTDKLPPQGKI